MKRKKIIIIATIIVLLAIIIGLIHVQNNKVTASSKKFKEEYESINNKIYKKSGKKNRTLSIPASNPMEYITAEELAKKIDNKETFIVYFGFAECPWCRSVIETVIETAKENNLKKIYYVDVQNIRGAYTLDHDNNPVIETKGSKGYYELLTRLDNVLEDYTLTTSSNETIKVNEKRIYAPNMVAVVKGEAKTLESCISDKQEDPYMELTEEIKTDIKKSFQKVIDYIK